MVLRWSQRVTDGEVTVADDLATIVYREGHAVGTAEGAEIDHPARPRPREGMSGRITGGVARADGLAARLHRDRGAGAATGGAQIGPPPRPGPRERRRDRIPAAVPGAASVGARRVGH